MGDSALRIAAVIEFGRLCHIPFRGRREVHFGNIKHLWPHMVEILDGKPTWTLAEICLYIDGYVDEFL
jgi:hypothetical protein